MTILLEDGTPLSARRASWSSPTSPSTRRTGSFALRVVVPNPEHLLLPGMYVRAVRRQRRCGTTRCWCRSRASPAIRRATPPRWWSAPTARSRRARSQVSRTIGDKWLVEQRPRRRRPGDRRRPAEDPAGHAGAGDGGGAAAADAGRRRAAASAEPARPPPTGSKRTQHGTVSSSTGRSSPGSSRSSSCWPARSSITQLPISHVPDDRAADGLDQRDLSRRLGARWSRTR